MAGAPGNPELWIAGNIGITPFVGWTHAMDRRGSLATLFHCLRNEDSAAHLRELAALANGLPNFTLTLHASVASDRAAADTLLEATGWSVLAPRQDTPLSRQGTSAAPSPATGAQERTAVDGPGTGIASRDQCPRRGKDRPKRLMTSSGRTAIATVRRKQPYQRGNPPPPGGPCPGLPT